MTLAIQHDDPAAPHVAALLAYHVLDLAALMGEHAHALSAGALAAADVTFYTAWRGNVLAGFAAIRELASDMAN